jgi:MATE family multidrug resistance protein
VTLDTEHLDSAYYVIGIPFGIWLAFPKHMGLTGLWIGLTVSLVYVSTVGVIVCLRTDWQREVKKVEARLREGQKGRDQADVSEA